MGGNASARAYLSTEAKPGAELYWLVKDPRRMQRWAGVVYCERARRYEHREGVVEGWGDCGLRVGPFVFFGDPALLARIRTLLEDANAATAVYGLRRAGGCALRSTAGRVTTTSRWRIAFGSRPC